MEKAKHKQKNTLTLQIMADSYLTDVSNCHGFI